MVIIARFPHLSETGVGEERREKKRSRFIQLKKVSLLCRLLSTKESHLTLSQGAEEERILARCRYGVEIQLIIVR